MESLKKEVRDILATIEQRGGIVAAVESGYLKEQLVQSLLRRQRAIEDGEIKVVGGNCFTDGLPSPLMQDMEGAIFAADAEAEAQQQKSMQQWRSERDDDAVRRALIWVGIRCQRGTLHHAVIH